MKRKLLKFVKGLLLTFLLAATLVFSIYSVAWYSFTKRAEIYIDHAWLDNSFTFSGNKPAFSGYPSVPHAEFTGGIEHQSGLKFDSPSIFYTGFPVPTQIQTFEAPQGLKITGDVLEYNLNFDYVFLQLRVPGNLPATDTKADVAAWQKMNSPIIIRQIILKSGNIYARGTGTFTLDEDLQIKADINAHVIGMDSLMDGLADEKGEKTIAIARNFLNMMSKIDEKTGEKYFETDLKIQKRGIYFGPMLISRLPEIKWR